MIRDIATVMRGTLIAQAIGFAALPVLSRLFEPAAFGHYQLFISMLTLLLVLPTLRYEVALLRVEEGEEYRALIQICLILSVGIAAALGLIGGGLALAQWPPQIAELPFPLWMLLLAVLSGGIAQFITILGTREKAFATIANSKVLQSVIYVAVAVGIGALIPTGSGLILADVLGRVALVVCLAAWAHRTFAAGWSAVPRRAMLLVAKRYREYPYISTPGTLINVLGGILSPIMIYASFSAAASGQFGLLERSVGLPLSLVVASVGQVFTAQFSAELRRDVRGAATYYRRILGYMALLAMAPLVVLSISGPWLFGLVFGEEWHLAGQLSQVMAPAYASILLSGPTHMVLTVMGHQKLQTAWEISRLALVIGLWAAVPYLGIPLETAVLAYSIILVMCNLGFVAIAFTTLQRAVHAAAAAPALDAP